MQLHGDLPAGWQTTRKKIELQHTCVSVTTLILHEPSSIMYLAIYYYGISLYYTTFHAIDTTHDDTCLISC